MAAHESTRTTRRLGEQGQGATSCASSTIVTSGAGTLNQATCETQANDATTTKKKHSLLDLPAELRNRIYELILSTSPPFEICSYEGPNDPRPATQPPLARTCRQIRNESLSMHYELSTFTFSPKPIKRMTQVTEESLGPWPSQLHLIKVLQMPCCSRCDGCFRMAISDDGVYRFETRGGEVVPRLQDNTMFVNCHLNRFETSKIILDSWARVGILKGPLDVNILSAIVGFRQEAYVRID